MERFLIANVLTTPDGTNLVSHHRHDYVTHTDLITKKIYFIDGGIDYCRMSAWGDEDINHIWSDTEFAKLRQFLFRGGRGKDSKQALKYVALKNMSNIWVENTIKYIEGSLVEVLNEQKRAGLIEQEEYDAAITVGLNPKALWYIEKFKKELVYRQLKKIIIIE